MSFSARRGAAAAAAWMAAAGAAGCDDVSRFSTRDGQAYCGAITLGGAFRTGLSPRVQMRLTLDASALDGADPPGELSTFEAADGEGAERRLLDHAPLRPIAPLAHDALSRLEFGDGRERNAIYAVSPAEEGAESLLAVVSLRTDESVEVRLLRAGAAAPEGASGDDGPPPGQRQIFGVFRLIRRKNQCGF